LLAAKLSALHVIILTLGLLLLLIWSADQARHLQPLCMFGLGISNNDVILRQHEPTWSGDSPVPEWAISQHEARNQDSSSHCRVCAMPSAKAQGTDTPAICPPMAGSSTD
jgi:hypothetical protein